MTPEKKSYCTPSNMVPNMRKQVSLYFFSHFCPYGRNLMHTALHSPPNWTNSFIGDIRLCKYKKRKMTVEWQLINVISLMWDRWKTCEPRLQFFHLSYIREVTLIRCHSAVCICSVACHLWFSFLTPNSTNICASYWSRNNLIIYIFDYTTRCWTQLAI